MAASRLVRDYLPFLRRYARALTGNQEAGDAYVRATLETIAQNMDSRDRGAARDRGLTSRIGLYRQFHTVCSSIRAGEGVASEETSESRRAAQAHLSSIGTISRQALLLTALEGFSVQDAGRILGKSPEEVRDLVDEAIKEVAEGLSTRVLVIEDESVIALDLASIAKELGHVVLPVAITHQEALEIAEREKPGLILADIQLSDGSSGIEAVREILAKRHIPVVFITAYPERLLTGQRPEPTFLISKPFLPSTVKAVVSQALFLHPPSSAPSSGTPPAQRAAG
jgi:CheY-like chemotaxis protein/DNA-directed RNA polymerase specialized sigma24 family protein